MLRLRWARGLGRTAAEPETLPRLASLPRFKNGMASGK
jgi:hypothetical protein